MRRTGIGLLALLLLVSVSFHFAPTRAEDDNPEEFGKRRAKAIENGIDWLKKQQAADGSWDYGDQPFSIQGIKHMVNGCTALACYALLKAGVEPKDPVIEKGFNYIRSSNLEQVYAVGCILLALDARYNWEPPLVNQEDDAPADNSTHEKKQAKKDGPKKMRPPGPDLDLAQRCVDFLTRAQQPQGSWRYMPNQGPVYERNDASHPQYALLGLDAAERLGLQVNKDIFVKAIDYFLQGQEADGAEVASFPVPGADLSYAELKKIEKEMKDKIHKIDAEFKGKKPGDVNGVGHTEEDERHSVEREASDKIYRTNEKLPKMHARGWAYAYMPKSDDGTTAGPGGPGGGRPNAGGLPEWKKVATGSMTTSGLAALLICKAQLDGTPLFEKQLKGPVNKALRDGAAWIATNYSVSANPKGNSHHYYYMYGLERAGMLGLIAKFGEKDWYAEGTRMFVSAQKSDGSFDAGMRGTSGPVPDTCFALLFLAKGTTPVVRIPNRTATGPGGGPQPQGQPQPQPAPGGGEGK
jgi:hypothetical protein